MPPTNKKLPKKTLIIGGVAVLGIGYLIYRRKRNAEQEPKATEVNPYLAQSFIPVTANNVGGVGALSGVGSTESNTALFEAQKENQKTILEFLEGKDARKLQREENAERKAEGKAEREFSLAEFLAEHNLNLTGGGAPVGNTNEGTVTAPAPITPAPAPPPSPPPAPAPPNTNQGGAGSCPAEFPLYNPAPGKGCYRISRTQTAGGCICHGYKSGKLECQQGKASNGSCHW